MKIEKLPKNFTPTAAYRRTLLRKLAQAYPNAASELHFGDEFQLIAAVILSAQCTDKKVNEVTPALFRRFSNFKKLAAADLAAVERLIHPVNYYKTKARNLIGMAQGVSERFAGKLPEGLLELQTLPGVGRKTANVVLTELGKIPALPVDTHVFRVARRLGLAAGATPEKVEEQLKAFFHSRYWRKLHHWLIWHGRRVCKAPRPLCEVCPLRKYCPSALPVPRELNSAK